MPSTRTKRMGLTMETDGTGVEHCICEIRLVVPRQHTVTHHIGPLRVRFRPAEFHSRCRGVRNRDLRRLVVYTATSGFTTEKE